MHRPSADIKVFPMGFHVSKVISLYIHIFKIKFLLINVDFLIKVDVVLLKVWLYESVSTLENAGLTKKMGELMPCILGWKAVMHPSYIS